MNTTSAPVIRTATCGACKRFISLNQRTCSCCGATIAWDRLTTPDPDTSLPPIGTRERVNIEWQCIQDLRQRLNGTTTTASLISPSDLALLVSLTLDAAAGQGVGVGPITSIKRQQKEAAA